MPRKIVVTTGARLHFGLFAQGSTSGRQFGGVGLMVHQPGFELRAEFAGADEVLGDARWRQRVLDTARQYRDRAPTGRQPPPVRWEIVQALPPHTGLGSGTQIALATATALARLAEEPDVPAPELARRCGRGQRSAVGLHGFAQGGLIVDGGKPNDSAIGLLVARVAVPADWRFVLICPRRTEGLSGIEEREGFAKLPPTPQSTTDTLCRLALLDIVPSVMEADFEPFAEALYRFGQLVGQHFAPVQGGVYADPQMRELVPRLRARGIRGVGQSSWGPTLFVACRDLAMAQSLAADVAHEPFRDEWELTIVEPLNQGATVAVVE